MEDRNTSQWPFISETDLLELQEAIELIKNATSLRLDLHDKLNWLSKKLNTMMMELPSIFTLDVEKSQIFERIQILKHNKGAYYALLTIIDGLQPALSHLLDICEKNLPESKEVDIINSLFDLIENCTHIGNELETWLKSKKPVFDASLEFNEISVDHIDTLEKVIDTNIGACFEIQEDRFSSPVRHTPSFTLKQLVRLLATNTESSEVKVPTFSALEEELCRKYLNLKQSVPPIERSLTEILPQRIDHFNRRDVINIDYLSSTLQEKYQTIFSKFKFMISELRELKTELVDKRWSILFRNLNNELSFILDEVEVLQNKLGKDEYSPDIEKNFRSQLQKKSKTITKTFNVIYRASEFSLLDADVALKTNELGRRWLDIRPLSDKILSDVANASNDFETLSVQVKNLEIGVEASASQTAGPSRNKFGAQLLKKMNLKPIIVTGSPNSAEKLNPFYEKSSRDNVDKKSTGLVLTSVPPLPYREQDEGNDFSIDNLDNLKSSLQQKSLSTQTLEMQKMKFYATKRSLIPTFQYTTLPSVALQTPPSKVSQQWKPYSPMGHSLQPPTPMSVLLSAGVT